MAGEEGAETWYVRARGRTLGPLSWAQLQALRIPYFHDRQTALAARW